MKNYIIGFKTKIIRPCLIICLLLFFFSAKSQTVMEGVVIFKVLPQYRSSCYNDSVSLPPIKNIYDEVEGTSIKKIYPHHTPPDTAYDVSGRKMVDLSLIYSMEFSTSYSVDTAISLLQITGILEYAEADMIASTLYQPNDPISQPVQWYPQIVNQNYLQTIKAQEAWDITHGDPSIVIGVTDTYFRVTHEDLGNKIAVNTNDGPTINGIDDDNDGYIDNYYGWNFNYNSRDVTLFYYGTHGTAVAGTAAAHTNNELGIAGTGYDSRFLPIAGMSYPAIVYAADHGVKIINCSWRSQIGYFDYYQNDVINYAAINKDVVVVAAAGNDPFELDFYPASYDNVLSVGGATNQYDPNPLLDDSWHHPIDEKWVLSTWSTKVDIIAPSGGIYSTYDSDNSSYENHGGTSFASPMVAGAAALVRWRYPYLKEVEVRELLKATSDDVYGVGDNYLYAEKLGKGRLNMEQALLCDNVKANFYDCAPPAVRVIGQKVIGLCGSAIPTTPVTLELDFKNFLGNTGAFDVEISTADPDITMNTYAANLGALDNTDIENDVQFTFTLSSSLTAPLNKLVKFRVFYDYGGYTDYEYINVLLKTQPNHFIWGFTSVCENNKLNISYGSGLADATSTYNWTVPSGATINYGQGTANINISFGTEGGWIGVTETTINGCEWTFSKYVTLKCLPSVTYSNVYSSNNSLPPNTDVTEYIATSNSVFVNTGTSVTFHASNYILLNPGFHTESSSNFLSEMNGCNSCYNSGGRMASSNLSNSDGSNWGNSSIPPGNSSGRNFDKKSSIEVFPMPSQGPVTVKSLTVIKEITLINSQGRIIDKIITDGLSDEVVLDLSKYEQGLYNLQVSDGRNTAVKKIIVMR